MKTHVVSTILHLQFYNLQNYDFIIVGAGVAGMMYMRGHKEIFNSWAKAGNVGWTYYECLQFFKKAEANLNSESIEKNFHGRTGPMIVQNFSHKPALADDILKAGELIGYPNRDLNGYNQSGITIAQMMVDGGIRASTARMYLREIKRRNNLVLNINSTVTRVIINKQIKKALGVEYVDNYGKKHVVYAKKEIILSAGAFGSPHLLMLSGVGPSEELQKHGIDVVQNLDVGKNLHNHVSVKLDFFVKNKYSEKGLNLDALKEYLEFQTGPMASTGLTQITAFMKTKYASNQIPDIQLFFDGFSAECGLNTNEILPSEQIVSIRPTNIMTKSVGYLKLKSRNYFDKPLLYFNYFTHKNDLEVLKEGIKLAIRLSETKPLQKWGMRLDKRPKENCAHLTFGNDDYWECLIKHYTGPENHPAGTCKMGPLSSKGAVIDPELRVHGITNLRVIDASSFPYVPNGNPIASIIMLAEKGSHMIYGAWQC